MIQDLVFTDIKTYPEIIKQFTDHSDFDKKDDMTFALSEVYYLGFDFAISPKIDCFAMGRSSGMVAVYRRIIGISNTRPTIQLYDAQSKPIQSIILSSRASDCFLHVLPNDMFVCVTDRGDIITCSGSKEIAKESMGSFYPGCSVMYASFYETGVVLLLTDGNVIDVQDFKFPVIMQHFDDIGRPEAMIAIPREKSTNKATKVMLIRDGNLLVFDDRKFFEIKMKKPIISVAASYSYEKIAILLDDFTLIVCNQTLDKVIYRVKVDTNDMTDFLMMDWVGDIAPAIALKDAVVLGTKDEHSPVIFVTGNSAIFGDCDSVYILTQTQSYRISYVQDNVATTLDKYVESDSATLCNIFDNRLTEPFVEKLSAISNIAQTITDLIDTAEFVKDKNAQVFFVAAACFANAFSNRGRGNIIGKVNERLRIMNALYEIGMPITAMQLTKLSTDDLLCRLCQRGKHNLAFEIAKFMKYKISNIADDLVMKVIDTTTDDSSVISQLPLDLIRPSFAADYAMKVDRKQLAIMFSELETDMSRKSLLFAKMEQWNQALQAASETCDSSCLMGVLQTALQSSANESSVDEAIASCESAVHMLMKVPSLTTPERLGTILEKIPPNLPAADVLRTYNLFQSKFTLTIESCYSLKKLREAQEAYIDKTGDKSIQNMSLNDTLRTLILNDRKQDAKAIAKKCSVDSKRLTSLKFETYVMNKKWAALKRFGAKKKRRDLWPNIITAFRQENERLAKEFIDEIGVIDQKAKVQILADFENGGYKPKEVENLKPTCCVFNS